MTIVHWAKYFAPRLVLCTILLGVVSEYGIPMRLPDSHWIPSNLRGGISDSKTFPDENFLQHTIHVSFYCGGTVRIRVSHPEDRHEKYIFSNSDVVQSHPIEEHEISVQSLLQDGEGVFSHERSPSHQHGSSCQGNVALEHSIEKIFEQFSLKITLRSSPSANSDDICFSFSRLDDSGSGEIISRGRVLIRKNSQQDEIIHNAHCPTTEFFLPGVTNLYGIPEHTTSFALADGSYRLYNSDVFQYKLNDRGALYGAVPFLLGVAPRTLLQKNTAESDVLSEDRTCVGILWLNASDTSVHLRTTGAGNLWDWWGSHMNDHTAGKIVQWESKGGVADFVLFPGPHPTDVTRQHAEITGFPALQQLFAFGYHQSRWNYKDELDVLNVSQSFDEHNLPLDVLWLDIEHTDRKKYFTWDPYHFPTPDVMQKQLTALGRYLVTITDPHIKREEGYFVHDDAVREGFYIKQGDSLSAHFSDDYEQDKAADHIGNCWPGKSSWIDFLNPKAREWYASLFAYNRYVHSTPFLHAWIDMNEPSVFGGEGGTMGRDAQHFIPQEDFNGKENFRPQDSDAITDPSPTHHRISHAEVHNLYGFYHSMATYDGLMQRNTAVSNPSYRPFVLSRAFFAGSQRYAAVWTGDNAATWDHMNVSIPMCLSLSVSNIAMCGADIGGFFNDSGKIDTELLVRWYQLGGLLYPFCRGHSHHEAPRAEPYLFDTETLKAIRTALALRYGLLPYIYTSFYHTHIHAEPLLRPLFFEFPQKELLDVENAALLGKSLLVCPVGCQVGGEVVCPLPLLDNKGQYVNWYRYPGGEEVHTETKIHAGGTVAEIRIAVTSYSPVPIFIRSGSILPVFDRMRRNTRAMTQPENNPLTLRIALPRDEKILTSAYNAIVAEGKLFVDDYATMRYMHDASYIHRTFIVTRRNGKKSMVLSNTNTRWSHRPRGVNDAELKKTADAFQQGFHECSVDLEGTEGHCRLPLRLRVEKLEIFGITQKCHSVKVLLSKLFCNVEKNNVVAEKTLDFEQHGSTVQIRGEDLFILFDWEVTLDLGEDLM